MPDSYADFRYIDEIAAVCHYAIALRSAMAPRWQHAAYARVASARAR